VSKYKPRIGHWALGLGHWALGLGHWALGIGHWALGRLKKRKELSPSLALKPVFPKGLSFFLCSHRRWLLAQSEGSSSERSYPGIFF